MAALNVLMVGTGEYTTGFVGGGASGSDKKVGVVALSMFDLRRRGKVGKLSMVGVNGTKYPAIREHLHKNISLAYNNLDTSFQSFPADDVKDPDSYKTAIDALQPGDAITIFTPDPTHYPIALYAIERKIHVMITKPAVKLLEHHQLLLEAAQKNGVYVYIEHHKRYDPAYSDARFRAQKLGDFNYFYSYMSQPKFQLETFKAWAGVESDISYYLNSHHVDICDSMVSQLGYAPQQPAPVRQRKGSSGGASDSGSADSGVVVLGAEERGGERTAGDRTSEETGGTWHRLSFTYNIELYRMYRLNMPAMLRYKDQHKVLHFIGKEKPWHFADGVVDISQDPSPYLRFYADNVARWWRVRRSLPEGADET
ncbi:D-galacturonic acid reductase [Magnaporthiopsis poae ATCC 64411]|uniref:D-galacturonic acid reductase n=1 Tax=Magnaporthiopsis poae (strain ATCC 64411 / 73-15) TaxID=644358 RepID=A0A0C4E8U7_MAGP6|nr:D-galacturonic acid reductase [Magnaporthiopsis poae ATCC 64411]